MRPGAGVVAVLLLAGCSAGSAGAAASCVGPVMTVDPAQARGGDPVTVTVEWLHEGCNDHSGADEERPLTDVPVSFVQDGVRVLLGRVSGTGERYTGTLTVPLPAQATPGAAGVALGSAEGTTTRLTVLP